METWKLNWLRVVLASVTVLSWLVQENELETLEVELAQSRADLKLAFKRIADLQAALEDELDSDEDSLNLDDRYVQLLFLLSVRACEGDSDQYNTRFSVSFLLS